MNFNAIASLLSIVLNTATSLKGAISGNATHIVLPEVSGVSSEEQQYVVQFYASHPMATAQDGHYAWVALKESQGWRRGDVYNVENKLHPSLVVWQELPGRLQLRNSATQQTVSQLVQFLPVSDAVKADVEAAVNVASEVINHDSGSDS